MGKATVIFSRNGLRAGVGPAAGSVAIRFAQAVTLAPWSHCADLHPDGYVVEALASHGRVIRTPLAAFVARCSATEALEIDVPDHAAWVAAVEAGVGMRYGYLSAAAAWLETRRFGPAVNPYCSWQSARNLSDAGRYLLHPSTRGVLPWALCRLMWAAGARPVALPEITNA